MAPFARRCWVAVALFRMLLLTAAAKAQSPVAAVGGTVSDASGAPVAGVTVSAHQQSTGASRAQQTDASGRYRLEKLEPGPYEVEEAAPVSDRRAARDVACRRRCVTQFPVAGRAAERTDRSREHGDRVESNRIRGGWVRRPHTDFRASAERAEFPGAGPAAARRHRGLGDEPRCLWQQLPAGAHERRLLLADAHVGGWIDRGRPVRRRNHAGVSQESVAEFKVSTFNLDLATGVGASGAINVVTRRGTSTTSGAAFLYYRNQDLAAFPGLQHPPGAPSPDFARRQTGGSGGGPLVRDQVFWFANYERNAQDAVFAVNNNHLIFSKFDGIFPNPLTSNLANINTGRPRVRPAPGLVSNQHRSQPHERSSGGGGHALELAIRRQQSVPNPDRRHVHPHRKHDQRVAGVL